MNLDSIVQLSKKYGSDPDCVLAGGGNSSQKEGDIIAIKASGVQLGTIDASGFVQLSRSKLLGLLNLDLPANSDEREKIVLENMLAARLPGQTMRPSVETLLHAMFPFKFVVHLHPALVNGMLCSREALESARTLFNDKAATLPYTTPGFVLADAVRDIFEKRKLSGQSPYKILFLQNHGVFVSADTPEEIMAIYDYIFATLRAKVRPLPFAMAVNAATSESPAKEKGLTVIEGISKKFNVRFFFTLNSLLSPFLLDSDAFRPLAAPFTPDHIVYSGAWPLFVAQNQAQSAEQMEKQFDVYRAKHNGAQPKIIAIQNTGIFGLGKDMAAAERACLLFTDAAKIAWYAVSFGGAHPMDEDDIEFIRNWEVEQYRSSIALKNGNAASSGK